MILYYKNSFLASMVSMVGCILGIAAFPALLGGEMQAILLLIAAAFLLYEGWNISQHKAFQKWWKQVKNANLEPEIAKSTDVAVEIYKKNPCKRTLKKIEQLNPSAAAMISRAIHK